MQENSVFTTDLVEAKERFLIDSSIEFYITKPRAQLEQIESTIKQATLGTNNKMPNYLF